ncbi:MAG: hypothetical protein GC164_08320 [Phycisphaera sp.]|nr:hypothetical protein [Phycisphaera sp.]
MTQTSLADNAPPPVVPGTLAYFRFNPPPNASDLAWLGNLLKALQSTGVVPPDGRAPADGVMLATVLASCPFSFSLIDLKGQRYIPRQVDIDRLHAVLVIETGSKTAELRQVLRAVLSHYGEPEKREQSVIELPLHAPLEEAARFVYRDGWPGWLAIEWTSDKDRFYLGIGKDSLAHYFGLAGQGQDADTPIQMHRECARDARGVAAYDRQRPLVEFYADFAALRAAIPTIFNSGRTTPMLNLIALGQADSVMLHGRLAGTFLVFDMTTLQGGLINCEQLSLDHWPEDVGMPLPPGTLHLAAPIDWSLTADRTLALARLAEEPEYRGAFDEDLRQYLQQIGMTQEQLIGYFRGYPRYLLASDWPRPWLPIPGAMTMFAPFKSDANAIGPSQKERFHSLLAPFILNPIPLTPTSDLGVAFDPQSQIYWLDSPLRQLFKSPAWGWAGTENTPCLIATYSPQAVLQVRAWLEGK